MKRQDVYRVIDGEREHQEILIINRGWSPNEEKSPIEFMYYMQHYMNEAMKEGTTKTGYNEVLDNLRKVLALGVACAEVHGLPKRK